MKILKKVCGIVISVFLWAFLAISALIMVFMVFSKASGKQPTFFGYGIYQIVSGSMQPEIMVGDVVIGKKVDPALIEVGDNIIFNYQKIIVTHKVIAVNGDGSFITHGIANSDGSNEFVLAKDVLARQTGKISGLGYALNFLRSPFGFVLIIILPIGGLVIYQTIILTKRVKQYNDENGDCASDKTTNNDKVTNDDKAINNDKAANCVTILEEIDALKKRLSAQVKDDFDNGEQCVQKSADSDEQCGDNDEQNDIQSINDKTDKK